MGELQCVFIHLRRWVENQESQVSKGNKTKQNVETAHHLHETYWNVRRMNERPQWVSRKWKEILECNLFVVMVEDWNWAGNDWKKQKCSHWEQKNPASKMTVGTGHEAWGNSWITNYLVTFIEERLQCAPNELYFPLWFWSHIVLKEKCEKESLLLKLCRNRDIKNTLFI